MEIKTTTTKSGVDDPSKEPGYNQPIILPSRNGEPSEDYSIHSNIIPQDRYFDDDPPEFRDDALPLLPDEALPSYSNLPDTTRLLSDPLGPTGPFEAGLPKSSYKEPRTDSMCFMDRRLDDNPTYLQQWLEYMSQYPPRPFVQVRGTHTETVEKKKGEKETTTVVDFDVKVELTGFLYRDINARTCWRNLRTVENQEKVRRGTVMATTAPGYGGGIQLDGEDGDGKPSLREWCHRYCASHSGLKTFKMRRRVTGFDEKWVRGRLEGMVRETGYRGRVEVSFPVQEEQLEVYNACMTNMWRLTSWIRWMFILTLLFIFTWPYLWIRTSRFEVVVVDWAFSRVNERGEKEYVSVSEDGWFRIWGTAMQKAVLGKRQATLDHRDLQLDDGPSTFEDAGSGSAINGVVRNVVAVVNRQFGWGGDR